MAVKEDDLEHFCRLVKKKDGGPPWKHVMERSISDMSYQAWQRDPEVSFSTRKRNGTIIDFVCWRLIDSSVFYLLTQSGPPQYCSRTVYENATPELLRDFYWDDEFRLKWDDMLIHAQTLEECPATGTMIVHWVRKVKKERAL